MSLPACRDDSGRDPRLQPSVAGAIRDDQLVVEIDVVVVPLGGVELPIEIVELLIELVDLELLELRSRAPHILGASRWLEPEIDRRDVVLPLDRDAELERQHE